MNSFFCLSRFEDGPFPSRIGFETTGIPKLGERIRITFVARELAFRVPTFWVVLAHTMNAEPRNDSAFDRRLEIEFNVEK